MAPAALDFELWLRQVHHTLACSCTRGAWDSPLRLIHSVLRRRIRIVTTQQKTNNRRSNETSKNLFYWRDLSASNQISLTHYFVFDLSTLCRDTMWKVRGAPFVSKGVCAWQSQGFIIRKCCNVQRKRRLHINPRWKNWCTIPGGTAQAHDPFWLGRCGLCIAELDQTAPACPQR